MRKIFTPFVVLSLLLFTSKSYSQIVWTFTDSMAVPSANSYADITASAMTANNNTLPKSGIPPTAITNSSNSTQDYSNHSGTFNIGAAADTSFTRGFDSDSSTYFQFTLTPSLTTTVAITSIGFGNRSTGTGPRMVSVRTSLDNYAISVASDTVTSNSAWVPKIFAGLNIPVITSIPVTIRIYGYGGIGGISAGQVNWRIDDVTINGGNVLPVTLSNFTASIVNGKVLLNWSAASEVNMKGFSAEKSSDARTFREVSYVAASGKGSYSTEDAISNGVVYYRLKLVNQDGSFTYSKNVPVNALLAGSATMRVYPNPVVNMAIVSHPQAGANASLRVTDLNGRVLMNYPLQQNAVQTTINISKLMSGAYMLVYRDAAGKAVSTRLVKQ